MNEPPSPPLSVSLKWPGLLLVLLVLLWFGAARAADGDGGVVTAGPSWEGFTNPDGSGLYHEIMAEIFAEATVTHIYVPTTQALSMVAIGRADIKLCETQAREPLMLASHPMYENGFHVVYLRDRIGPWRGEATLAERQLVWREGYYTQADFAVPVKAVEVRSGESALKMVMHRRADFYVDDLSLIAESFRKCGESLDLDKYGLERVGTRRYYPVFARTGRGRELREAYEQGMERLYREGVLEEIYRRWHFPLPRFSFDGD